MTAREQLIKTIENTPDSLIEEILDFCLFIKHRQQKKPQENQKYSDVPATGISDLLNLVDQIQSQVPPEEWEKLPRDLSINHDHYLYGAPKVEE